MTYLSSLSQGVATSASIVGTQVHKYAENIAKGNPQEPSSPEAVPIARQFDKFVEEHEINVIETELTVFSRRYHYAGTLDGIWEIDGTTYIVDIKSGKRVYPEAALQLAAYRNADFVGRPDGTEGPFSGPEQGAVLHLRPDSYRLVPVVIDTTVYETFLSALDMYYWTGRDSKFVLGI